MILRKCIAILLLLIVSATSYAQNLKINTYTPCKLWVIKEDLTLEGSYSWEKKWCKALKTNLPKDNPHNFRLRPNRSYIVIIYNPKGTFSDGVILKGITLKRRQTKNVFIKKKDFTGWHNLNCE